MVPFDCLENVDYIGTSKHAYLCYFGAGRIEMPKRTKKSHFFEIEKKLQKHYIFLILKSYPNLK